MGQWIKEMKVGSGDGALSDRQLKSFFGALPNLAVLEFAGGSSAVQRQVLSSTLSSASLRKMTRKMTKLSLLELDDHNPFERSLLRSSATRTATLTIGGAGRERRAQMLDEPIRSCRVVGGSSGEEKNLRAKTFVESARTFRWTAAQCSKSSQHRLLSFASSARSCKPTARS